MVTHTNFIVGTESGLKLLACFFVSRETTVILNESEIRSGTERGLDYNQSGTVAVQMLLLSWKVLLRCLCVRTQAWEDFSLSEIARKKRGRNSSLLIGMKCLIDIGGRHPRWLGYCPLCCEPASWNWHLKSWPAFLVEKTTLCYSQHGIIESLKLEKTFIVFVIRAQMHKTCCRFPDLEQGSWICTSLLKASWYIWAPFHLGL